MKEQNSYVEYSRSEMDTQPDETKWDRFDALTDADIDTAAASDADDPKTDTAFWKDATVVMPGNVIDAEKQKHVIKGFTIWEFWSLERLL